MTYLYLRYHLMYKFELPHSNERLMYVDFFNYRPKKFEFYDRRVSIRGESALLLLISSGAYHQLLLKDNEQLTFDKCRALTV